MNCRICGRETAPFARATLLGKHPAQYFRCPGCGFVQTEEPYWLDEAYAAAITGSDVGLVSRNLRLAVLARGIIAAFFRAGGRFLDYGGGYGLFVRLMRDAGYDFYRYDKHCANLLAADFEADAADSRPYELVTAFEVLEHLVDPVAEVTAMLKFSRSILVTTELLPATTPQPEAWWYYGLDHGQHVSLFSAPALRILAERCSLNLYTNGRSLHLLSDRRFPAALFPLAAAYPVARLLAALGRRQSLVAADYARSAGRHRPAAGEKR